MYKILHIPTSLFISKWSSSPSFLYLKTEFKDFYYSSSSNDGIFTECIFNSFPEAEYALDQYINSMHKTLEDENRRIKIGSTAEFIQIKFILKL